MTRLTLVRHGETDWNVENRKQGRIDRPLNSNGTAQAKLVAEYVRAHFDVRKVWSSPLKRCAQTAKMLGTPVSTSDLLMEIDYVNHEGILTSESNAKYPVRTHNGPISLDPTGSEKRSNLPIRGRQFLEESRLSGVRGNGDIVIVGHGSAMRGLLVALLGLPDNAMRNFVIDNGSVSTVQMETGGNRLTTLNHTAHLAHLTRANGA